MNDNISLNLELTIPTLLLAIKILKPKLQDPFQLSWAFTSYQPLTEGQSLWQGFDGLPAVPGIHVDFKQSSTLLLIRV